MDHNRFEKEIVPALRARLIWDIVPDDKIAAWSSDLGITPAHTDVARLEQDAADRRRQALAPIAAELGMYSVLTAEIIAAAILKGRDDHGGGGVALSPETVDLRNVILQAVMAVVASLVDSGRIEILEDEDNE